jgi:DNA-binding transcriptional LysR family regulator
VPTPCRAVDDRRRRGRTRHRLRRAEIDLALSYEQKADDIAFEPLAQLPTYIVPAGHGLARSGRLSLSDLAGQPFILPDLPVSRDYFQSLFERAGVPMNIVARSEQSETIRSMVGSGLGYTLLTARPASRVAVNGRPLAYVPLSDPFPPMQLGLLTARNLRQTRTADAFATFCRERITNRHLPGMADLKTCSRKSGQTCAAD